MSSKVSTKARCRCAAFSGVEARVTEEATLDPAMYPELKGQIDEDIWNEGGRRR